MPRTRTLLIACVLAAVIGQTAMIMVHELVHLLAGVALGYPSTMYAFGVDHHGDPSVADEAFMNLSAPVFSLVSGLVMQVWQPFRRRADLLHLTWLFFAFASVQEMVGYLVITPFGAGDTGSTATLLGIPPWVQLLACAVGIAGMFANARAFAPHLMRYAGQDLGRRNAVGLFPWLYGMIICALFTLLYLTLTPAAFPVPALIAVMAANTALLVFAPMANIFLARVADVPPQALRLRPVPVGGLIALAVLVLVNLALSIWGLSLD